MNYAFIAFLSGLTAFYLYDNIKKEKKKKKLAAKTINEKGTLKINPPVTITIKKN